MVAPLIDAYLNWGKQIRNTNGLLAEQEGRKAPVLPFPSVVH